MQPNQYEFLLKAIQDLSDLIKDKIYNERYESDNVEKISEAFAQAQLEYDPIVKNCEISGKAYSFAYASLDEVLNIIRPSLAKHGLSFHQFTKESAENNVLMLHSRLRHSSGQWFESRMRVIVTGDKIQDLGIALTYYRRYSALMLLGHHPENEDNDGTIDVNARKRSVEKFVTSDPVKTAVQASKGYGRINETELADLEHELQGHPEMCERLKKQLGLGRLSDMAAEDYRPIITKIRTHKASLSQSK